MRGRVLQGVEVEVGESFRWVVQSLLVVVVVVVETEMLVLRAWLSTRTSPVSGPRELWRSLVLGAQVLQMPVPRKIVVMGRL